MGGVLQESTSCSADVYAAIVSLCADESRAAVGTNWKTECRSHTWGDLSEALRTSCGKRQESDQLCKTKDNDGSGQCRRKTFDCEPCFSSSCPSSSSEDCP